MINRQSALTKVFGDPQVRIIKNLRKKVATINKLSEKYKKLSKSDLKNKRKYYELDLKKANRKTIYCQMHLL